MTISFSSFVTWHPHMIIIKNRLLFFLCCLLSGPNLVDLACIIFHYISIPKHKSSESTLPHTQYKKVIRETQTHSKWNQTNNNPNPWNQYSSLRFPSTKSFLDSNLIKFKPSNTTLVDLYKNPLSPLSQFRRSNSKPYPIFLGDPCTCIIPLQISHFFSQISLV
jgi:hypothetical protein